MGLRSKRAVRCRQDEGRDKGGKDCKDLAGGASLNFCGIQNRLFEKKPRFCVLPVPYDLTASYMSGMRNGPRAILEASLNMELFDEELESEPCRAGIETLDFLEPVVAGPEEMIQKVYSVSREIVRSGKVPVVLGGEHSITLGLVRALRERYPGLSVLQFDAHADMRDTYQNSPFSHACVARRISEICPIVQVGIRSLSSEEAEFLKRVSKGSRTMIRTHYARDVLNGLSWSRIVRGLSDTVFVTIDLDVFDPSVMPATGTPEPGGLGWYEVTGLLREVTRKRRVVGFDVVELCPIPGNIAPDFLAARLTYRLMGYINSGMA